MSTFRSYSIFFRKLKKRQKLLTIFFPLAISFLSIISAYIIETSYRGTFEISFYGYNLEQTEDFADNLSKQIYMRKSTQQAHEYITKTIVSSESKEDITAQENCKLSELLDTESIEVGQGLQVPRQTVPYNKKHVVLISIKSPYRERVSCLSGRLVLLAESIVKVRDELLQEKQADKCGLGDENCEELFDITFSYILLGLNKKLDKHFRHWKFQRNLSTVLQDQTISRDNNFHYEANMELVLRDAYSAFPTEFDSFRVVQKLQTAVNENINKEKLGPNFLCESIKNKNGEEIILSTSRKK